MRKKTVLTGLLVFTFIGMIFATTWFDIEVKCPICNTNNTFMQIGSYGSYIYQWPEKYEYIYWPVTESYSLYSCGKCKYSAFMWDFDDVSTDTIQLIKAALDTMQIEMKAQKDYNRIPMYEKLETAELFYKLYKTDSDFWCRFYRIKGYHYHLYKMEDKALENRLLALNIAENMLADPANDYRKKEILLITGAMKYFTEQDSLALLDFELAKTLDYNDPNSDPSNNTGFNQYLDALFTDYIDWINNPEE